MLRLDRSGQPVIHLPYFRSKPRLPAWRMLLAPDDGVHAIAAARGVDELFVLAKAQTGVQGLNI